MPTTSPRRRTALAYATGVLALGSALLAAALTLVLAGQAPGAFAFTYPSGTGPAGAVKLNNGTLLVAREAQVALPSGVSVTVPQLVSPGVTVSPSPAYAGSQVVKVGYWVNMTENGVSTFSQVTRKQVNFAWGTSSNFWALQGEVLGAYVDQPQLTGSRSYEVSLSITWYDSAGEQLAMVWMQPDQATENRCDVTAFTCTSSAKGITLSADSAAA